MNNKDVISIQGLVIECIIGCLAWEREVKQKVSLDLWMDTDIREAARTDDVEHCINYDDLCRDLTAMVSESHYHLIETMAENVAKHVLDNYACQSLRLTVNKHGAVPNAERVSVTIERSR